MGLKFGSFNGWRGLSYMILIGMYMMDFILAMRLGAVVSYGVCKFSLSFSVMLFMCVGCVDC